MFVLAVLLVVLFVLLGVLALGHAAALGDEPEAAALVAWAEEPDWWDDPEWEWPECARVEELPVPRLIVEQVV